MSNKYSSTRTGWLRYSALLLVAFLFSYSSWSQITSYSYTALTGEAYSDFTLGIAGPTGDDASTTVTLPFSFAYNGTSYTGVRFCTNGWISFNTGSTSNSLTAGDLFNANGPNTSIAGWLGDGNANGANGGTCSSGAHPSETDVYVFQWNNVSGSNGGAASATNLLDYQIWLYGPTSSNPNAIEIRYGANAGTTSTGRSAGIEATASGTGNYINALNGLSNSTATFTAWPGTGAGYRFAPPAACVSVTAGGATSPATVSVCSGASFTLNVTGATTDSPSGVTYQWWDSADDITFDPIVGATSASLTTSTTADRYYYRETICAAGPSSDFSASTAVTVLPESSFPQDMVTFVPCGWTSSAATTFVRGNTASAYGIGTGSLMADFFSTSSGTGDFTSPVITALGAGEALYFDYAYTPYDATSNDQLVIRASTDGGTTYSDVATYAGASANPLATSAVSTTELNTPVNWANTFAALPTGTNRIMIRFISGFGNNMFLDNFTIAAAPSCLAPSALGATNITTTTADLGWTENGTATVWNVEYGAPGFTPGNGEEVGAETGTTSNPVTTTTALSANTTYQFYVQADCGGDESAWAGPYSFSTACGVFSTFPFNETFEAASASRSCWDIAAYEFGTVDWEYGTGGFGGPLTTAQEGTTNARFSFDDYSGYTTKLVSPTFDLTSLTVPQLNFYYAIPIWFGDFDELYVYYRAASTDPWTLLPGASYTAGLNTWTEASFTLPSPSADYQIAFEGVGFFGGGALVDNLTIQEAPTCPAPSDLDAANATTTTVEVNWTENGSALLWNIEVGAVGFTPEVDPIIPIGGINALPYTVSSGISAGNTYEYYVQADCGGDVSSWSGPFAFSTAPGCGGSFTDPGGAAGPYADSEVYEVTICPDTPGDVVSVTFTAFATEQGYDGLMIYDGPSTASPLISSGAAVGFDPTSCPAGAWSGSTNPGTIVSTDAGGCLTFRFTSDPVFLGDNTFAGWESTVTCGPPPTCGNPNVSGIVPSYNAVSFTINASGIGTPVGYEYEIVLDGATPTGTGVSSVSNIITSATTLTPETAYDFYVRTDCDVTDGFSEWVGPFSFTTNPAPPANDDCVNAIAIDCSSTGLTGTTLNSTVDANYSNAGAGGTNLTERGVWYVITPGVGENFAYTINTCDATGYDTRLTAFQAAPDCASLTPLTGNDDNGACGISGLRSEITFNAFEGNTYYLFVHGWQPGASLSATGDFLLNISCEAACAPPANDACAAAEVLVENATCINTTGETTCSANTVGLANPAGVSGFATFNDVWYTWTATVTDYYLTFSNLTATNLIYTLYVGDDCGTILATGVDGFDVVDGFEQGLFGATIGETYWIRVGADPATGTDGSFDLCLQAIPCSTPNSAVVTATTQTNINVVIDGIEGDDYIIEYGPAGFTPGEDGTAGVGGTIINTSTLINDFAVAANSNYDVYIRKDCSGAGDGYSFNIGYTVSTFIIVPATGSNTITTCDATIYDAGTTGNYPTSINGTLTVYPGTPGSVLALNGSFQGGENCCDFLRLYEGVGTGGTLLAEYFGTAVQTVSVESTVLDGPITIQFISDISIVGPGFELTASCLAACSGVPSVGALVGPATACSGVPFTMSVASPLTGYNYQWQRITGAGWTNIVGANGSSYVATQTATTTYRCRVTCSLTSNYLGISAPKTVGMTNPAACYCTPTSDFGTTDDDFIVNVTSGAIDNTTGASVDPFYTEYAPGAGTTTSYAQGGEYSVDVTISTVWGDVTTAAWIDFNRNGIFEPTEKLGNSAGLEDFETATFDFVVPANASLGTTRLRVRADFDEADIDACAETGYGETEDYTVTLVAGSANDAQANATAVAPAPFPACVNYNVNLANATPSTGAGNDVWYQFVAASNAARISVTSSFDVEIEVRDVLDAVVDAVEDASAAGNETFITSGLVEGDTYWVAVRDNSGAPSTCSVCIQSLNSSTCDNGPNFASLCNSFKADWTGTASYNFTFVDQSDLSEYTASTTTSTQIVLANIPGLRYGRSYDVTIDAVYNLVNAGGVAEQVTAISNSSCPITIAAAPAVNLRASDRDPQTRNIGAFIGTDVSVCAVVSWDWSFELVDEFGDPLSIDGPVIVNTGSSSRYFRTSNIPGVAAGDRYRVRIRPVFAYGAGDFDDVSMYYLKISGGAGIIEGGNNDATPSENAFVLGNGSGASAAIYPNPSNGEMVNLNLAGINSDNVNVRILDATGRLVWSNRFVVEGSLNTIVSFDRPLAAGLYVVEMTFGNEVITERMMVQK